MGKETNQWICHTCGTGMCSNFWWAGGGYCSLELYTKARANDWDYLHLFSTGDGSEHKFNREGLIFILNSICCVWFDIY